MLRQKATDSSPPLRTHGVYPKATNSPLGANGTSPTGNRLLPTSKIPRGLPEGNQTPLGANGASPKGNRLLPTPKSSTCSPKGNQLPP